MHMVYSNGVKFQELNQGGNHVIFTKCTEAEVSIEKSAYSIKIPIQGQETYTIDSKYYKLKSGEFLIVNKNQNLNCLIDSPTDVKGSCVYLSEQLVDQTFNSIINKDYFSESTKFKTLNLYHGSYRLEDDGLSALLMELKNGFYDEQNLEEWYCNLTFEMLKHQLDIQQLMDALKITKQVTKQELYERLNVAKSYIIDNYKEDLTIESISLNACISKFHLIRTFKEVFGLTPYNYLTKIRLDKAFELISTNAHSLEDIALRTGFKERQNLTRNFKKQFGFSPSTAIMQ